MRIFIWKILRYFFYLIRAYLLGRDNVLILATSGIGDTVLLTTLLIEIKKKMPHCCRVVVGYEANLSLLNVPELAEQLYVLPKGIGLMRYCFSFQPNLLRRYCLSFIASGSSDMGLIKFKRLKLVAKLSASFDYPEKIVDYRANYDFFLHETRQNLFGLECYLDFTEASFTLPKLFIREEEKLWARAWLQKNGLVPGQCVLIHCGFIPKSFVKALPLALISKLLKKLEIRFPGNVRVLCGQEEKQFIQQNLSQHLTKESLIGGIKSTRKLAAILSQIAVLISSDTGPMHIASAVETPVIACFGPSNFHRYRPTGAQVEIIRPLIDLECEGCWDRLGIRSCFKDRPCLNSIDISQVMSALVKLFDR